MEKRNNFIVRLLMLILGITLIVLAIYFRLSGIRNHEDGNLLVNSVLCLILIAGGWITYKTINGFLNKKQR